MASGGAEGGRARTTTEEPRATFEGSFEVSLSLLVKNMNLDNFCLVE